MLPDEDIMGLAGAEQKLVNLNLNAGQLSVQRQILQLRVDFLNQLNTQTMLIAGSAASMLGSLELEAMVREEHDETLRHMALIFLYIVGTSISLGCSIWVLYTSNNLINLATMSALQANSLADVQAADNILGLRMRDVRRMYVASLVFTLPAIYVMVFHIIPWWAAAPGCAIVLCLVGHAVHADQATAYHFTRTTGVVITDNLIESSIDKCFRGSSKVVDDCLKGTKATYEELGGRLERRRRVADAARRVESTARTPEQRLAARFARRLTIPAGSGEPPSPSTKFHRLIVDSATHSGYLLKTPSNQGPLSVLHSTAISMSAPTAAHDLITETPARTPSNKRWFVLQGRRLACYTTSEDWEAGGEPSLLIELARYSVLRTFNSHHQLVLALLPKRALSPPIGQSVRFEGDYEDVQTPDGKDLKSWYLRAYPVEGQENGGDTEKWMKLLARACATRD